MICMNGIDDSIRGVLKKLTTESTNAASNKAALLLVKQHMLRAFVDPAAPPRLVSQLRLREEHSLAEMLDNLVNLAPDQSSVPAPPAPSTASLKALQVRVPVYECVQCAVTDSVHAAVYIYVHEYV